MGLTVVARGRDVRLGVFWHGPGEPAAALDWWPRTCLVFTEYGACSGLAAVIRLVLRRPVLRSITVMFALFNIGEGMLIVFLPRRSASIGLGTGGYGYLVAALTFGELVAAALLARYDWRRPLVPSILVSQIAAAGIAALLIARSAVVTIVAMAALGFVSAPMTAWAQTLRMRELPAVMHGRLFAVLRTAMQATTPIGAAAAAGLSHFGASTLIGCVAAIMALPVLGGAVDLLRVTGAVPQADG